MRNLPQHGRRKALVQAEKSFDFHSLVDRVEQSLIELAFSGARIDRLIVEPGKRQVERRHESGGKGRTAVSRRLVIFRKQSNTVNRYLQTNAYTAGQGGRQIRNPAVVRDQAVLVVENSRLTETR